MNFPIPGGPCDCEGCKPKPKRSAYDNRREWRVAVTPEGHIIDLCGAIETKAKSKGEVITVKEPLSWSPDKPTVPGVYLMLYGSNQEDAWIVTIKDAKVYRCGRAVDFVAELNEGYQWLGPLPPTQEGGDRED